MTSLRADYLSDYRINVHFSDGTQRVIDFADAFSQFQSYYAQYHQPDLFQSFTIDNGNLVWGDYWNVIYPTDGMRLSTFEFLNTLQRILFSLTKVLSHRYK